MPGALTDVQATTPSSASILVTWRSPSSGVVIDGFEVSFSPVDSCPEFQGGREVVDGGSVTQHTLRNLKPSTTYSIRVRARGVEGLGPYSVAGMGMTQATGKYCSAIRSMYVMCSMTCPVTLCLQPPLVLPSLSMPLPLDLPPSWSGGAPHLAGTGMAMCSTTPYDIILEQAAALRLRQLFPPMSIPSVGCLRLQSTVFKWQQSIALPAQDHSVVQ